MPKITIIGAGSVEFTRSILADLCAYEDTLAQKHPNALITATRATATHPLVEHPEWQLF